MSSIGEQDEVFPFDARVIKEYTPPPERVQDTLTLVLGTLITIESKVNEYYYTGKYKLEACTEKYVLKECVKKASELQDGHDRGTRNTFTSHL